MQTFFSSLALCDGNLSVIVGFPSKRPVTRSFDIYLICVFTNGWENNREAGDLGHRRAHLDVIVMSSKQYLMIINSNLSRSFLRTILIEYLNRFVIFSFHVLEWYLGYDLNVDSSQWLISILHYWYSNVIDLNCQMKNDCFGLHLLSWRLTPGVKIMMKPF